MTGIYKLSSSVRLFAGSCIDGFAKLKSNSVDAIITDPPYPHIKRDYGYWTESEWFTLMDGVVSECRRVLKSTGSAVFILQPNSEKLGRMRPWLWEFMAKWTREWGMVQDVWWWNFTAIPQVHSIEGRLTRPSVKACVWLGPADCWRDQDKILWSEADSTKAWKAGLRAQAQKTLHNNPSGHRRNNKTMLVASEKRGGVLPFNLLPFQGADRWEGGGKYGHGASTPINLMRWWTRFICPPEGVVLDPFAGSGTAALAAVCEGRKSILMEQNEEYCKIIATRIQKNKNGFFYK